MSLSNLPYRKIFNITFFFVLITLAVFHIRGTIKFDAISLALIVLSIVPALLPFISKNFKSFEFFGVRVDLLEQKVEKQEVKLEEQQTIINELVKYSMSASIFHHLCGISLLKKYIYNDNESDRREFYFLRDNGFIQPKGREFNDFDQRIDKSNLVEIAEPTPIGKTCVRLRIQEIPSDMLKDTGNLRIDPKDL